MAIHTVKVSPALYSCDKKTPCGNPAEASLDEVFDWDLEQKYIDKGYPSPVRMTVDSITDIVYNGKEIKEYGLKYDESLYPDTLNECHLTSKPKCVGCCDLIKETKQVGSNGNGTGWVENLDGSDRNCFVECPPEGAGLSPKTHPDGSIEWVESDDVRVLDYSVVDGNYVIFMSNGEELSVPITSVSVDPSGVTIIDPNGVEAFIPFVDGNTVSGDDNDTESTATAGREIIDYKFSGENTEANGGVTLPDNGQETRGTGSHFIKPRIDDNGLDGAEVTYEFGARRSNTNFYDPEYFSDEPRFEREDKRYSAWDNRYTGAGSLLNGVEKFYGGIHSSQIQTRTGGTSALVIDMNELHTQDEDLIVEGQGDYRIVGKANVNGSVRFKRASRVHAEFGDIDTTAPNASSRTIGADSAGSFAYKQFFIEADDTIGILRSSRSEANFDVKTHTGLIEVSSQSGDSERDVSIDVNFKKASNLTTGAYSTSYGVITVGSSSTDSDGTPQGSTPTVTGSFRGEIAEADVNGSGGFSSTKYGAVNVRRTIGFSNFNPLDVDGNEITTPVADPINLKLPDVWSTFEIDSIYNRNGRTGAVVSIGEWARAKYNDCRIIQEHPSTTTEATMIWSHGGSDQVNDLVFINCQFLSDDPNTAFIRTPATNVSRIWLIGCRGNIPLNQIGGGRVIINGVSDLTGASSHTIGTGATDVKPWEYTYDPTLTK